MEALARIFFHVKPRNANALTVCEFDGAMLRERLVVLRDLISLGQVRIEVVLAREDAALVDRTFQRKGRLYGELHGTAIEHGQRSRQSQTHGTDVGIRRHPELRRAAAKRLGGGEQLHVDLEPDYGLVPRAHLFWN